MSSTIDFRSITKPNFSLTSQARLRLFLVLALLPLIIAIAFATAGIWLVLPFAGLELFALGYAFYYISLHAQDYEDITITNNCLTIEKRNNKQTSQTTLNPYWAQVVIEPISSGETRIWLRSHGKSIEVGCYMNSLERIELARKLQARLSELKTDNGEMFDGA